jgi:hypothetical protein
VNCIQTDMNVRRYITLNLFLLYSEPPGKSYVMTDVLF